MENREQQVIDLLGKLDNKDFNLYFFVLDTKGNPVASVANIYEHVKVLRSLGFNAGLLHEKNEYHGVADWLGSEYAELPHYSIESQELKINPIDFVVVPEVFAPLMQQISKMPCKKIVFSQSYHYILELLPMGIRWNSNFNFNDVITTSNEQANYIKSLFPSINVQIVPVSIPEYFKPTEEIQKPIISILTRDQSDVTKIVKSFYLQYPMYKWVTFRDLRGLPRETFAEELSKSCLAIWVDDISGFGTFPLEAMECNVPVIGKIPNLIPEWMKSSEAEGEIELKNNGIWTNNVLNIPELISSYMKAWLEDSIPMDLIEPMLQSKGNYTEEKQVEKIKEVYGNLVESRKTELMNMIPKKVKQ